MVTLKKRKIEMGEMIILPALITVSVLAILGTAMIVVFVSGRKDKKGDEGCKSSKE